MKKKSIIFFICIVIISTVLKILWIKNIPLSPVYDFETLYKVAVNLFQGKGFNLDGYAWGFQSYGYPLILSLFFRIINNSSVFTAKIFNVIVSTLTLPILFLIYSKIFKNEKIKWTCFIISALLPNHIVYNNVLGTEVLTVLFFSIILCMNLYITDKNRNVNFVIQGIFCGVASLVKPFFMAYPVVLIFIYFIKEKNIKTVVMKAICLIAGFLTIFIPSIIKNYKAFNEFIPISYNGGFTLYVNNNSQNLTGTWMNGYKIKASEEFKSKLADIGYIYDTDAKTEKEQNLRIPGASKIFKEEAVKWIISNPGKFLTLGLLRIGNVFFAGANDLQLWGFDGNLWGTLDYQQVRLLKIAIQISDVIVFVLSLSVVFVVMINFKNMFKKQTEISMLLVLWSMAFFYAVYFVIEGQARYNFPTLFLMIIAFGFLLEKLQGECDNGRGNKKFIK